VQIKLLTTSEKDPTKLPTKANFKAAFADTAKTAKPEDIIVVYLAGHGTSLNVGDADTYFYLTQESESASKENVRNNPERAVSNVELLDWLTQEKWNGEEKGVKARRQVMILDTCAAGAFEGALTSGTQRDLTADQIRALERLKDRTGLQILMGSAADQSSYEASQYGQGLLTYSLLQAMKGAKLRDDKFVDTSLLFGYAADTVLTMANGVNGIQKPRIFGASGIDIGLMSAADRDLIKLESPKPIVLRPNFSEFGETNEDPLDLTGKLREKFNQASEVKSRSGNGEGGALLVFIDQNNFPGAYRLTGTYTQTGDTVKVRAFLRKVGESGEPVRLDEVSGTVGEAAEKLFQAILKQLESKQR